MEDKQNYIFFYGGKTKLQEWAIEFKTKLENIVKDSIIKNKNITIKWFDVGITTPKEAKTFWSRVESVFMLKLNQEETDPAVLASTQEIQKLFSNKEGDGGWAVLAKGSVAKIAGDGLKFLKVLEKFDEWKENVEKNKAFEVAFNDYYSKIMEETSHCCRLDIPIVAGKPPEHMKCAQCESPMEMFTSYKCCKGD